MGYAGQAMQGVAGRAGMGLGTGIEHVNERLFSGIGRGIGAIPGVIGGAVQGAYGMVHGPARAALGITAAVGVYQTLTQAMQLYEQRARGVIDIGMRQDLQFDKTGDTIDRLRKDYYVLAHDSLAAMRTFGRATGLGPEAVIPSVRFGAAYGIDPAHAGAIGGALQMLTAGGRYRMAEVAAGARAEGRGRGLPMAMEPFLEEATTMAGMAGAGTGLTVPAGYIGRWQGIIGQMGERYRMPGQTARMFGEIQEGLGPSNDPGIAAIRARAFRAGGRFVTVGQGANAEQLDLETGLGILKAQEALPDSPELQQRVWVETKRMFPDQPEMQAVAFQRLFGGGRLPYLKSGQLQRQLEAGGGPGRAAVPGDVVGEDQKAIARLGARDARPEAQIQIREAKTEPRMEQLGEPLVTAVGQMREAVGKMSEVFMEGNVNMKSLAGTISGLDDRTLKLIGVLETLSSNSALGIALGLATAGAGFQKEATTLGQQAQEASPVFKGLVTAGDWLGDLLRPAIRAALGMAPLQPTK
jgi:hypothetical protein